MSSAVSMTFWVVGVVCGYLPWAMATTNGQWGLPASQGSLKIPYHGERLHLSLLRYIAFHFHGADPKYCSGSW